MQKIENGKLQLKIEPEQQNVMELQKATKGHGAAKTWVCGRKRIEEACKVPAEYTQLDSATAKDVDALQGAKGRTLAKYSLSYGPNKICRWDRAAWRASK
eukprot:2070151-Pleurochrysis_carterae.AAC.12